MSVECRLSTFPVLFSMRQLRRHCHSSLRLLIATAGKASLKLRKVQLVINAAMAQQKKPKHWQMQFCPIVQRYQPRDTPSELYFASSHSSGCDVGLLSVAFVESRDLGHEEGVTRGFDYQDDCQSWICPWRPSCSTPRTMVSGPDRMIHT